MRATDERGSVTVFMVGVFLALIVVAGLVFDGGSIIAGHREADAEAEGAARAAAEQIANTSLHAGTVAIAPAQAQHAVAVYLAPYHHRGTVAVNGDNVTVTVSFPVTMQVLSVIGVGSKTVSGSGSASAIEGAVP
jgi:Flp pilus assembly protein TadG